VKASALNPPNETLTTEIGLSLGLHLMVAVLLLFKFVLFPGEPIIVDHSIRVDMVDLPEKKTTEAAAAPVAPPPAPSAPQKVETPKKSEAAPKVNHKLQNSALERIRALQEIESEVQNDEAKPKTAKPQTFKGQVLNPGTNPTGVDKLQLDEYVGDLDEHVKKNWMLPQWLKNANLQARVLVWIDSNGNVIRRQITQSSQNSMYDEKVLEAIDRASPFPKPPARFARILEVSGVEFGFPE
jgi:colicin import membrane protein